VVIFHLNNSAEASESCCSCFTTCCKGISSFFDRPFSCWAVFCFLLLGAGAVLCFLYAGKNWANEYCDHNLHIGLLVLGICYVIQNFANFYTVYRYSKIYGKHSDPEDPEKTRDICKATKYFLCYDFFMCFFIFFILFSIVWACLYIGYATDAGDRSFRCRRIILLIIYRKRGKRIKRRYYSSIFFLPSLCGVIDICVFMPINMHLSK